MRQELIIEVRIDDKERLLVRATGTRFDKIYRAALGVQWDFEAQALASPVPREWNHLQWFEQILAAAADEYGTELRLAPETLWTNVPSKLRRDMDSYASSGWLSKLIDQRQAHDQASWDSLQLEQALSLATPHWESGRYAEYVECLVPVRNLLSPAQLKRLTIAESRAQS